VFSGAIPMLFRDREDAAERLAQALAPYKGVGALVLAIPRGAVPMAAVLAERLGADLDIVLVRKLGAPFQPELALAAIDESGDLTWTQGFGPSSVSAGWLESESALQLALIRRRRAQWPSPAGRVDPAGRTVIVVDDGLATGSTMVAALRAIRRQRPARLVCAVPVAATDSLERVRPLADEVVCLQVSADFDAVSRFYTRFDQVEDDEVARILLALRK
jgi:putative phosphoribosyl transferase